jgi:hypothetical protein
MAVNSDDTIVLRLKEIEEELRTFPASGLSVELESVREEIHSLRVRLSKQSPRRPSQLYGMWKGKSHFTYEEIKEAEIRLSDD